MKSLKKRPRTRRALTALGALCLLSSSAWSQPAPSPQPPPAAAPAESGDTVDKEVMVLSPFEVNTSRDQGYAASTTLSGTRLNSNLEDIAASLSVVTKQQLNDTAAIDINDVFLYESNTEGTGQYTEFVIDRTFYNEVTTQNPQSANRIRGIGAANMAINNFAMSSVIPIDTYNVDSIEISRGPNANIFGLGNASGTVNLNTSRANTSRNAAELVGRVDSVGGWRSSLNVNRVLMKDRAAVMFAAVRDDKGFEREPAYEKVRRFTGAFTVKPLRSTTIRASYENYQNDFSRANNTLPRDTITEWMNNGQPVWNPVTSSWRLLNGTTYTAVTTANEATQLPLGLQPGGTGFWANPSVYIEPDGAVGLYAMNAVGSSTTSPAPAGSPVTRYVETGSIYRRGTDIRTNPTTPLILFQPTSITDQSIYDYTSVNFQSPNFGRDSADIIMADVEQGILNTPHHRMVAQLGYYHESISRYDHSVFSKSDSATPFLAVDVNEFLIDGTPNPYFLRPYMGGSQPGIGYSHQTNSNVRGTLAYQLDFSRDNGWSKWLGHHNLAAYAERRDLLTTSFGAKDLNVNDYSWTAVNDRASIPLRGNTYRIFPRYYVGGDVRQDGPIYDYAPAERFSLNAMPLTWFRSTRARVDEPAAIAEIIQSGNSKDREIRTLGATLQSFFWDDRIVTTVGWRKDRNRERASRNLNSNNPATNATSTIDPSSRMHDLSWVRVFPNPWEELQGESRNYGVVFKATKWLNLNFSRSNSFKPEALAYDINTNLLPNPTGKTTDYGVTLKLWDDKLVARITRYKSVEKNSRNGSITSAAVTRTLRMFFDPRASGAPETSTPTGANFLFPNGQDAFDLDQVASQWYLQNVGGAATPQQAHDWAMTNYLQPLGIDQAFIDRVRDIGDSGFTDVNTVTSTGTEFEVTYNPSRFWTMKLAGAQQKAVDTELGNAVMDFMVSRLDALRQIIVPTNTSTQGFGTAGRPWWQVGATSGTAGGTSTPSGFYVANVRSVIGLATANAGKPRTQTREWRFNYTTNYNFAGLFDHGFLKDAAIGGSVRWESKASVGYYGQAPSTDPEYRGAIIDYDADRPIFDKARAYVDFFASYNVRAFSDKVRCKLQLNVRNAFEGGRLQPIGYNPDGVAWNYRIIDPRQVIFTTTFDF